MHAAYVSNVCDREKFLSLVIQVQIIGSVRFPISVYDILAHICGISEMLNLSRFHIDATTYKVTQGHLYCQFHRTHIDWFTAHELNHLLGSEYLPLCSFFTQNGK